MPPLIDKALQGALGKLRAGKLAEAESDCLAILRDHPGHVDTLFLLGQVTARGGRLESSADYLRLALAAAPRNPSILVGLAESLRLLGRMAEALPLLHQAVDISPASARAWYTLAANLTDMGRPDEALAACRTGLKHNPDEPNLNGLAAESLIRMNQPAKATGYLYKALGKAPDFDLHWERLGMLLRTGHLECATARPWLLKALAHPVIRPGDIAGSVAASLCEDPLIAELLSAVEKQSLPREALLAGPLAQLGSDPLLLALMKSAVIPRAGFERLFTGLRRALLLDLGAYPVLPDALPFCASLAIQSYLTDYAWDVTGAEISAVDRLAARLEERLRDPATDDALLLWIAIVGAYRPLHGLNDATEITQRVLPATLSDLVRIQIGEPLEERALRAQIRRLTPVTDPVSQQVHRQYEENPYPRWIRADRAVSRTSLYGLSRVLGGTAPPDPSFARPEVLIAGCGTGEQSVHAASFYQDARILAIDLSLASLAYAIRKTRELGIDTIEYCQGDILELQGLGQRFHVIECVGVLHHLADPVEGWRILRDLLRPGGMMQIALYSEQGRRAIVQAREHIARSGYTATAPDIRRCRREILDLPDDHPLAKLRRMRDLYNLSECRDLLFHVQEHRFTLPRIGEALNRLGLRFLGFIDPIPAEAYRGRFPEDTRMQSLEHWHEFETAHPDTFAGMYQFWVQRR